MIAAHIAGIPVEETILSFAPLGLVGLGIALATARQRIAALLRRIAHPRRRPA
jgi:hypothetical protein